MEDIFIARTPDSPEIHFQFSIDTLSMRGEAYPENASEFFGPVLSGLSQYLDSVDNRDIEFNFSLTYFNSASTKMLYRLFELLHESACTHNRITLNWHHDEEDDTILDFGHEVKDDFPALDFRSVPIELSAA